MSKNDLWGLLLWCILILLIGFGGFSVLPLPTLVFALLLGAISKARWGWPQNILCSVFFLFGIIGHQLLPLNEWGLLESLVSNHWHHLCSWRTAGLFGAIALACFFCGCAAVHYNDRFVSPSQSNDGSSEL